MLLRVIIYEEDRVGQLVYEDGGIEWIDIDFIEEFIQWCLKNGVEVVFR